MNFTHSESFAGIGAWGKALERVTERHSDTSELKWYAEWDKYASNAFAAIHGISEDLNIWDVGLGYNLINNTFNNCYGIKTCMNGIEYLFEKENKSRKMTMYDFSLIFNTEEEAIEKLKLIRSQHKIFKVDGRGQFILPSQYVFFYSPPCQTYSIAGKREGSTVDKGNLFWSALKKIKLTKPKYAIMENVRGLPSGDTKKDFNNMLWDLEKVGYVNDWAILNTKDYGIPQNRERVFIVSIRKDLYNQGKRFEFPKPFKLKLKLIDMLEKEVDDKYYLSQKLISGFLKKNERMKKENKGFMFNPKDGSGIANAITARCFKMGASDNYLKVNQIGNISDSKSFGGNPQTGRVYGTDGLSPSLSTMQDGGQEPKILLESVRTPLRFKERNGSLEGSDYSFCIDTTNTGGIKEKYNNGHHLIRKLIPLECFRLQGFNDEDYFKAVELYDKTFTPGSSDSQMYKRAGNSITVNVIEEILENLLYNRKQEGQQLSLF